MGKKVTFKPKRGKPGSPRHAAQNKGGVNEKMKTPLVLRAKTEAAAWSKERARLGETLGLTPTMGALHAGHRALIERAAAENDAVAVSIFVNPLQFGAGEDLDKYPRTFEEDLKLCGEAGVDCVFAPTPEEMFDRDRRTFVEVGGLSDNLCGLSRPGHFRGVATVVTKLLNLFRPDRAYFGRKDAQQLRIIEVLARDLDFGCEIVPCETVREPDGLPVSSRNRYLSPAAREQATVLWKALSHCRRRVEEEGERNAMKLLGEMAEIIGAAPEAETDYVALVDADTFKDQKRLHGSVLAAVAVYFGSARLIDNIRLELGQSGGKKKQHR